MAPSTHLPVGENFSKAERRLLLFQVDLGSKELNTVLSARGLTDTRASQDSVRISDPVDYDDPSSPIYWRKVAKFSDGDNNNAYVKELRNQFAIFMAQFQAAISDRTIRLKSYGPSEAERPYVDISDFTKSIGDYAVRLDGLENKITVTLARPESTDLVSADKTPPGELVVNFNDDVFGQLNPNENDIIVVKNAYSTTEDFAPEFIGVITKVQKSFNYGRVDSFTLEVSGLSKILYSTQMIKNKSVRPNEFIPGIELNDKARTTPYSSNFDKKNVREVFKYILDDSLSCKEIDQSTATFLYRLDPSVFVSFEQFGFQHNIYVLLALYLMSVTEAPNGAEGSLEQRLFPQTEPEGIDFIVQGFNSDADAAAVKADTDPRTAKRPLLDFFIRGVLERGDHRAYNRMARQGVERFFSEMAKPADILNEVRSNSYTDIFESRDGIVVCRPPRYNKVESTKSEVFRTAPEVNFRDFLTLSPAKVWEFNPNSDFVIKSEELISIGSISKDELALESRIDVKAIFPMRGEVDYPTALYVDPDILFRYGLRTHGAVTNPNAYNKKLARLFAPISLAMVNAPTRTIEVTVKDTRKFYVGKLYYLEAIDMVAYLVQDTINHSYSAQSSRQLSFSMLRQVIRRPIAEILRSSEEILNVGMMFTSDFPNQTGLDKIVADGFSFEDPDVTGGPIRPTPRSLMYTKGKRFLEELKRNSQFLGPNRDDFQFQGGSHRESRGAESGLQSKSDVRLVMFKYIPSIEDLIMEVESTPRIVEPPVTTDNSVAEAKKQAKDIRIKTFVKDGFLYFTAGQPAFKSLSFMFQRFRPALAGINNEAVLYRKDQIVGSDPTAVQYQRSALAPEAVAGALGYLFPVPIQEDSPFDEVVGSERTPVVYQRTPFRASSLADPAQNLVISQVLTDQLASLDLFMKFEPTLSALPLLPSTATSTLRMDKRRIPQLYYLLDDEFLLFGSKLKPDNYISSLNNEWNNTRRGVLPVLQFQNDMLEYPSMLKLNKDGNAFENDFFSIPIRNGKFNLPFGHFVLKQKSGSALGAVFNTVVAGSTDTNLLSYYRAQSTTNKVLGGSFTVTKGPTGDWLIKPDNNESQIVDENTGQTVLFGEPALDRSSPAPNELYFTSPFLEPTIERLLDIPLPIKYGGNLTSTDADVQKRMSSKGALTSQAFRQNGQGINLSPDYLFVASKGEITAKAQLYVRFEAMAVKNGIFDASHFRKVENAATAPLILPNGVSLGSKPLTFYTLFVQNSDEDKYSAKIQVSQTNSAVPS